MFNIVLHQPQIPPNTGNIARLCVGTGSTLHLIRPLGFFLDDKSMKRAGCDYWDDLKLKVHDSLDDLKRTVGNANIFYATKHGRVSYTDARFKEGDYLVFGSEEFGLPEELLKTHIDNTIKIPVFGPIRSHNLANSVAIVLYEAIRQIAL